MQRCAVADGQKSLIDKALGFLNKDKRVSLCWHWIAADEYREW